MKRLIATVLTLALLLGGCSGAADPEVLSTQDPQEPTDETTGETTFAPVDPSEYFSERDLEPAYDESRSAVITLSGTSAACDSDAVQISGSTVTITDEGTYILRGTLEDGMIIVNSEKTDKTQLVLDGVTVHSETSAPIYILQSDKVFITLAEDSVNTLSNGGSFTAIDDNNIDSVIFSKEDVTLNGAGSLTVSSPAGHGIVSKDSLTVTGGSYEIVSASHGLCGKDDVCIANATMTIAAGKDGIQADNDEDTALGYVYIESGTFSVSAEGDGISASAHMTIAGGSFDILTGGGSANAQTQTSDSWGGFMGGPGMGGRGDKGSISQTAAETEDSTSIKGIKAAADLTICGGTFTIDAADDALHSNANLTLSGGTFDIATGDDGFHADDTLTVTSGTVSITRSYEGLEGLHIAVSGGQITLVASDDGLNAAGGTDQSGFGGFRGNDGFGGQGGMGGMSGSSDGSIVISGGTLDITASGDGIDANGTLEISGGYTTVCGPTQGDTATLDYDTGAVITGGTFIGTGGSTMAQTFSDSQQGVIAVSVGSQNAGTQITLTDTNGSQIISYAPALSFGVVILSSPDIVKGETYTITVGSASGEFAAS